MPHQSLNQSIFTVLRILQGGYTDNIKRVILTRGLDTAMLRHHNKNIHATTVLCKRLLVDFVTRLVDDIVPLRRVPNACLLQHVSMILKISQGYVHHTVQASNTGHMFYRRC